MLGCKSVDFHAHGFELKPLPHPLLLGPEQDVDDIVAAIEKIQRHADELRRAEHPLVALKGTNRAERDRKARLAGS